MGLGWEVFRCQGPGGWLSSWSSRSPGGLRGTNSHPTGPGQAGLWGPGGCRAPADCSPNPTLNPQEGRQHQGLAPPGGGKTTLQVIRFKLKIIKITYKIKKDNPCPNKLMTRLPGPLDTLAGEGGGTGSQPTRVTARDTSRTRMGGPASTVSSSSLQKTAIWGRRREATKGYPGPGSRQVSSWVWVPRGSSCALHSRILVMWTGLALEIYCTVLEEAWG